MRPARARITNVFRERLRTHTPTIWLRAVAVKYQGLHGTGLLGGLCTQAQSSEYKAGGKGDVKGGWGERYCSSLSLVQRRRGLPAPGCSWTIGLAFLGWWVLLLVGLLLPAAIVRSLPVHLVRRRREKENTYFPFPFHRYLSGRKANRKREGRMRSCSLLLVPNRQCCPNHSLLVSAITTLSALQQKVECEQFKAITICNFLHIWQQKACRNAPEGTKLRFED